MSQENVEVVRGLLAHWATRFALLLSLLALGALGPVACDDDETATDETATAKTEVIISEFGQDPPGRGRVGVADGDPDACGDYRKGPGGIRVEIEVFEGVVRCREARRVLKNYYPHDRSTPPWSCEDAGDELVQCAQPGAAFRGILYCRGRGAECPGFGPAPPAEPGELAAPNPPGADLFRLPARKHCGHLPPAPPGIDYPLIWVEVIKGDVPCREARHVIQIAHREGDPEDIAQATLPWGCVGPEGLFVCQMDPGGHHKAIRARFR